MKAGKGVALRKETKALFAYFLSPLGQKVRRLAGRDPPVLIFKVLVNFLKHS